MKKHRISIVYDGVAHSVFAGQVLDPAVRYCTEHDEHAVTIVSFEKRKPSQKLLDTYNQMHPRVRIVIKRRLPFLGIVSLLPALYQLKRFLRSIGSCQIKARGPLAGWLAVQATRKSRCTSLVIQARGLLAEEYWHRHGNGAQMFVRVFHIWRHMALNTIEQYVYGTKSKTELSIRIEAVSNAMKEHLIGIYGADSARIDIAADDIPQRYDPALVAQWRQATRAELGIPQNAQVYCYSGSLKSWQTPDDIITFYKQKRATNSNSFLLLLTTDQEHFTSALAQHDLPMTNIVIRHVPYTDMYRYLSAADTGLLFRQQHIVSWVARPVKAMEYQSVGLDVIHNGTVGWLQEQEV